ncbi:MAG TPA: hypothetical protein VLZ29_01190 [Sulfurimonas sp.]|uniref:hypothetical protein n=1 Tax=Sulfurimonas sp. TaxID=2022749 RepID=UPI002C447E7E|nr:hypothetical protein [Sulfurimonas sp.]HUH41712.1 hypothetical protein [Sulfurimonas sp.]
MTNKPRRICATCGKKKYLKDMYVVHYPLIHKIAIHCSICYDESNMFFLKLSPQGDK